MLRFQRRPNGFVQNAVFRSGRALFSSDAPMTDVRGNHKFDEKLLCQFLSSKGLSGFADNKITVKQFSHGQSNPSFMISDANGRQFTVRKQPPGKLLPGAHAVDREFAVMSALKKSKVAVPSTRLYCDDPSVLGSSFFVYGERVTATLTAPILNCTKPNVDILVFFMPCFLAVVCRLCRGKFPQGRGAVQGRFPGVTLQHVCLACRLSGAHPLGGRG